MGSRPPRLRLRDILDAILAIAEMTAGMGPEDYAKNRVIRDAVERNVERLSEASRHLPDNLKEQEASVPWREIAGIGNILRHAYDGVDNAIMWDTLLRDLPILRGAVERLLKRVDDPR